MKSGQADTCLINSYINALAHMFALALNNGWVVDGQVNWRVLLQNCALMVMGDDIVLYVAPGVRHNILGAVLTGMGFISKLKVCEDPSDVTFLNMIPYPIGPGVTRFAPKLGRLFDRLGWSVQYQKDVMAYNCAIGKGFRTSTHHVPVLRSLVHRLIRSADRSFDSLGRNHDRGLELDPVFQRKHFGWRQSQINFDGADEPTLETYAFLQRRYGWSPEITAALEARIATWPQPPALVSDTMLDEAVRIDCS